MDPAAFREAAHVVADAIADYLENVERYAVFPAVEPGSIATALPGASAGDRRADRRDPRRLRPARRPERHAVATPGFMAYFATTASGPGILGEMLTAAIGQNPMLWRTSPIGTELEEVVVGWLRQGLGLPDAFDGLLTDTASTSSLIALGAAREAAGLDIAARGLAGRADMPTLRVYASQEAHSSIEKACMTLGIGRENLVRIAVDDTFAMRADALSDAIATDRKQVVDRSRSSRRSAPRRRPRSTRSPISPTIAERQGVWLHVDAAYAGPVALIPSAEPCSPAGSAPTRSSSTRTSGCSPHSTRRCC